MKKGPAASPWSDVLRAAEVSFVRTDAHRMTRGAAWVGDVEVQARTLLDPAGLADYLHTRAGYREACGVYLRALRNAGEIVGDLDCLAADTWGSDPVITVAGSVVTFRRSVEVEQPERAEGAVAP